MNKKILLAIMFLVSIAWQPSHHFIMNSGLSMAPQIHSLVTMFPFMIILSLFTKSNH